MHAEVALGALADAGLTMGDVDAYFCSGDAPGFGPVSMADYLGLKRLSYVDSTETGLDEGPRIMTNIVETEGADVAVGDVVDAHGYPVQSEDFIAEPWSEIAGWHANPPASHLKAHLARWLSRLD